MMGTHHRKLVVAALALLAVSCSGSEPGDSGEQGWKLPPAGPVTRGYPRLVNYYHASPNETPADQRSERLAQWDVVVVFPYKAESEGLSFAKMRQLNPRIKILAWIPLGQSPDSSFPFGAGVPRGEADNWFLKDVAGGDVTFGAPYYEHIMNPYKASHAWASYIVGFVKAHYLDNDLYDGVFLDCLFPGPPDWLARANGTEVDVNEDGVNDVADVEAWREGVIAALNGVKEQCPGKLVTGNPGNPLDPQNPYWQHLDGAYHENALGDEFGSLNWSGDSNSIWDGYQGVMGLNVPYYMIGVDVREGRSREFEIAKSKNTLTKSDLRRMRLGLGTTLLGEGYFGFDSGDGIHGQLWWFDEYDADLGEPTGPYSIEPSGLHKRVFTRGMVLVNPTGMPQAVALGAIHRDATTKEEADSITVPAQDARIVTRVP